MTYELMAREFPDYVQASLPEIPESWEDTSWHNDTCPSFYCEDAKMTIHIDEEDAGLREFPGSECRFIVTHPDGSLSVNDVLQTNDWQRVLDVVAEAACPRVNGGHRDTGRGVCAHCGKVLA